MKITQAEFVISAMSDHQLPDNALPEVALAGRSNVGKSSLINRMIERRNLARTSSQPGKTQTLNYYLINSNMYFVDFPGYGYAKVSKAERQKWGKIIEKFILTRETLRLVLLLVDFRHPPSNDDVMMWEWLHHFDVPVKVVATKVDKVPKSQWSRHEKAIRERLQLPADEQLILFSSETGMGRDPLWSMIEQHVNPSFT